MVSNKEEGNFRANDDNEETKVAKNEGNVDEDEGDGHGRWPQKELIIEGQAREWRSIIGDLNFLRHGHRLSLAFFMRIQKQIGKVLLSRRMKRKPNSPIGFVFLLIHWIS
ncbi:hypothetical protein M9H77_28718 [Catharanthus roseus]|uniref:Uncharacterized protein n=1 Tax=Catharanthus roseus TaxID=4058 RepID=A0ACC0AHS3_CATRO|nr:hypothetical protein M9H77_28718 [Catharanthus roseus]